MALPQMLARSPLTPIALPMPPLTTRSAAVVGTGTGATAGGALSFDLNFAMQPQLQDNWCWAATSASVHKFFAPASTDWSQCEVVDAELNETTCCADGSGDHCNKSWFLDRALTRVGHFDAMAATPMSASDIQIELAARRPIGCRIGWPGGGGHFVVLDGLALGATTRVAVRDPIAGTVTLDLSQLGGGYQGAGTWTHSYKTKA